MSDQPTFEEKLLSQEAKRRISEELDEVEQIDIDIKTDIGKLFQGQVDKVELAGQGLVIQDKIRVQDIKMQTDRISINPLSVIFGQLKLNEPVNSNFRIVLTEADINDALTSEMINRWVRQFKLNVDGEIVSFEPQEMQVFLPGDSKLEFKGKVWLKDKDNTHILGYHAIAHPRTQTKPPRLKSFHCTEGEGIRVELIAAAMQKIKEIINLPDWEWENMVFSIIDMEVKKGSLILILKAHIKQIPSMETILSPD
ncbi:LmeA family phospholipid-binding protein [Anabaena sp. WFMT]|uniref:LmeA family phospholipid-binding protein n=1 Tax=Anabaena sp. WFMT TaxID=3449730 RepID=UPI003F248C63